MTSMKNPSPRRPASIFVWLSGALGDTLLAYPALAALRKWATGARITFTTRPTYGAFALSAGLVDRILDVDLQQANALFGAGRPDSEPTELAVVWSSAYREFAQQFDRQGVRVVIAAPPMPTDTRHQARYLLDCLRPLGIPKPMTAAPPPPLLPLSHADAARLGREGPVALLHPGAGARWKQWPVANWLALADGLSAHGYTVRWSFGADDADTRLALLADRPSARGALLAEETLPRFAALLAQCALLVSADTGVAHLAALLRVPQVTLFGPTDPRRWRPLSRVARVLVAPDRCGGRWVGEAGHTVGPPPLRRCAEPKQAVCACLAALPVEGVLSPALKMLNGDRTA
jgi:ADP-heptose:LPS heptosyltransferase